MTIRDRKALRQAAAETLQHVPNHRMLILISMGSVLAVTLVLELLSLFLTSQINSSTSMSGLSGIDSRAMLLSVQEVLSTVVSFALPFWSMGYLYSMMQLSRGKSVSNRSLLEGFRMVWPILRVMILEGLILTGVAIAGAYVAVMVLVYTPLADPAAAAAQKLIDQGVLTDAVLADPEQLEIAIQPVLQAMVPLLLVAGAFCAALLIPVFYRLRLTSYRILDDPKAGARFALRTSNRLMRHNCFAMFRLDLSFWWYYLLEGAAVLLASAPGYLALLDVTLPVSDGVAQVLCSVLGLGLQLLVCWYFRNLVEVTYIKAYDALVDADVAPPAPL